MAVKEINPQSTMQEILDAYPAAKQALFQKYHIGGCSSCGFDPSETLASVLARAQQPGDPAEAIEMIKKSQEVLDKSEISPSELEVLLKDGKVRLVDVRTEEEHKMVSIDGDQLATRELAEEIMGTWKKDTPIVLYCHTGARSLQAAMNLASQGFTHVKSLKGGIDAWSQEIDPLLPRY